MSPIDPNPVRHAATALGFAVEGAGVRAHAATTSAPARAQIAAARSVAKALVGGLVDVADLAGARGLVTACRATLARAFALGDAAL